MDTTTLKDMVPEKGHTRKQHRKETRNFMKCLRGPFV